MEKPNKIPIKWRRILLGYAFVIIGVVGAFLPILQAWAFFVVGIVLLKDHTTWARWLLDLFRDKFPKYNKTAKQVEKKVDKLLQKIKLA